MYNVIFHGSIHVKLNPPPCSRLYINEPSNSPLLQKSKHVFVQCVSQMSSEEVLIACEGFQQCHIPELEDGSDELTLDEAFGSEGENGVESQKFCNINIHEM